MRTSSAPCGRTGLSDVATIDAGVRPRRHRRGRSPSTWIVGLGGGLAVAGTLIGLAATVELAAATGRSPVSAAVHDVAWVAIAAAMGWLSFVAVRRVGLARILTWSPVLLAASMAGLAAVMVPGLGTTVGGAARWIPVGPFQVQPSEFAKFALVLYLAKLVTSRPRERVLGPVVVVTALVAGAIFIEPDMGSALVVAAIGAGALVVAKVPVRRLVPVTLAAVSVATVAAFSSSYRRARLLSFLHPWRYRASLSYQEVQALGSFATAHITGSGLGAGLANWGYVPNAVTDFVMTLVVQDFGVIGALGVICALGGVILGLLALAERTSEPSAHAVAVLVAVWFAAQTLLNLGAVVGLLPVTGVPLPFVSQGGSSLVVEAIALGAVLASARHAERRR